MAEFTQEVWPKPCPKCGTMVGLLLDEVCAKCYEEGARGSAPADTEAVVPPRLPAPVPLSATREQADAEVLAVLEEMPQYCVVRVHEGGGPENIYASLAVSALKLTERERSLWARVQILARIARRLINCPDSARAAVAKDLEEAIENEPGLAEAIDG